MIAIIPARGGSKGLPGKNTKLFLEKPLIAYTIEAAQKASSISEIIVSTDDQDIADIATEYGAICPFLRPEHLATDACSAIDVFKHLLAELNSDRKSQIEEFIVLQPTSPLRTEQHIEAAIQLFNENKADSVVSYTEEHHPIVWHKYLTDDNRFVDIFNTSTKNRQEHRVSFYPNGAIFIFKLDLIKKDRYYSKNSYAYLMPPSVSVDIDDIEDFEYAEYLLKKTRSL